MNPKRIDASAAWLIPAAILFIAAGCHSPDPTNILLRKENSALSTRIESLNRRHDADQATVAALQRRGPTTLSLPQDRIDQLFTTHGLAFGLLTGGYNADNSDGPDEGIEIAVVPTDDQGSPLKAAGSFTVQAFDLSTPKNPLIGTWTFPLEKSRDLFYAHLSMYTYILKCPWQQQPQHSDLMARVTFVDELTGRQFTADRSIKVTLAPATTQP